MNWSQMRVCLVLMLSLLRECTGQSYSLTYEDDERLPDLALPPELSDLEGLPDLGGGPKGVGGLEFKPDVVKGMMMGDVLRRIENLELLCKAQSDEGVPRPTPLTLNTDSGEGLKLKGTPKDSTPGPAHYLVPGPETEGKDLREPHSITPKQLEKTVNLIKESMFLVASEQDKLREEFTKVMTELSTARQELSDVRHDLNQSRLEMMPAVERADKQLKVQGRQLEDLATNVSSLDMSLSAFHSSFYELSHLNRSLVVALKETKHTTRRVTSLSQDVRTLKRDVGSLQSNWNKTMKEAARRLQRSYTVGKDVNKLQKQFHAMKSRVVKINGMKCDSGRIMFMNYPFSFGKWPLTRVVTFKQPFSRRPQVTYGMTQLDVNYRYNTRARVRVLKVNTHNLTLACDSWYDTRLYRMEVSWMACSS